jgi:hypothetical protein
LRFKLEYFEGTAVPKEIIQGTKAQPRITRRHCWPRENDSKVQNPVSNSSKALLAQKRQFEEPKPRLE